MAKLSLLVLLAGVFVVSMGEYKYSVIIYNITIVLVYL